MSKPRPRTRYAALVGRHPRLAQAHELISAVAEDAGPLDAPTRALIKLALSVGAGLESAVRRHARGAALAGASAAAIEQTLLLGVTTLGFPRTLWALKALRRQPRRHPRREVR